MLNNEKVVNKDVNNWIFFIYFAGTKEVNDLKLTYVIALFVSD